MIFQERDKEIIERLTKRGQGVSEISREMGIQRTNLHARIAKLVAGGYLRRVNRYELTRLGKGKMKNENA